MPDTGLLLVSAVCLVSAVVSILFPKTLEQMSGILNRTVTVLDQHLLRHRHLLGLALFAASYLFFRLALSVPQLHQ